MLSGSLLRYCVLCRLPSETNPTNRSQLSGDLFLFDNGSTHGCKVNKAKIPSKVSHCSLWKQKLVTATPILSPATTLDEPQVVFYVLGDDIK